MQTIDMLDNVIFGTMKFDIREYGDIVFRYPLRTKRNGEPMKIYLLIEYDRGMGETIIDSFASEPLANEALDKSSNSYLTVFDFNTSLMSDNSLINELCNRFDLHSMKDSTGCITIAEEPISINARREPIAFSNHIIIHHGITDGITENIENNQ